LLVGPFCFDGRLRTRIGEDGVSHASLVIIRQAPRIVQPISQAKITHTATVVDSGKSA